MPWYTWKNTQTGREVEIWNRMEDCNVPPAEEGEWERVYSFGVGRVEGAGSSPARPSVSRDG